MNRFLFPVHAPFVPCSRPVCPLFTPRSSWGWEKLSAITRGGLLKEAYLIADEHGLSALSVRALAQACRVSVGTIYNHFSSKDELTASTIELYFRRSVMDGFCRLDAGKGFVDYCEDLYGTPVGVLSRFRRYWLRDFCALTAAVTRESSSSYISR